jgi:gas vesicle protein
MGKAIRFLAGLTFGIGAGFVAGLLLAPESGDDLRITVRTRLQSVIEAGQEAAAARQAELRQELADARSLRPDPRPQL